jgi:hypothetical protein
MNQLAGRRSRGDRLPDATSNVDVDEPIAEEDLRPFVREGLE